MLEKNETIKITDEDISKCKEFSEKVLKETYDRFHQDDKIREERIFYGKLGEVILLNYFLLNYIKIDTSGMFEIYEGQSNVDQFDFKTSNGKTIDVKTAYKDYHTRVLIPFDQFDEGRAKDYYVGIKLDMENRVANICGYITKDQLKKNGKKDFGEGLAYWEKLDNLFDIKNLLKEMQ